MTHAERLDVALVRTGLARSRGQASELIASGRVRLDGHVVTRASSRVVEGARVEADTDPWVSRAAHKLLAALAASGTLVGGRALDAGASTGGFTQVLLQQGCDRIYAVDVGHGQLAPVLRGDPRVVVREGLNLRDLTVGDLEDRPVDLVVADVSFISLTLLVGPLLACLAPDGVALLMVKPQFELGRAALDDRGVVDPSRCSEAVDLVVDAAASVGWECSWRGESALPGASGNREFFIRLTRLEGADGPGH